MSIEECARRFREEVKTWLRQNFPEELRGCDPQEFIMDSEVAAADQSFQLWRERVSKMGWGAPTWPRRYGGADLDPDQARILQEEMAHIGAFNPVRSIGQMMLGPTLLDFGTREQMARFLPPIADGTERWCQGFSEPGAGSDLASLKMRCVDAGEHWIVDGQKIWTSGAHHAHWCFCLVRTDTSRKQGGITFLLIDMRSPGIETRPITLIDGTKHFCEVFFDDVKVPKENIVGAVNGGWDVAKKLLQHERSSLSAGRGEGTPALEVARRHVGTDELGRVADPDLRYRLIDHGMRVRAYGLLTQRYTQLRGSDPAVTAPLSILKNLGSSVAQQRCELVIESLGFDGVGGVGASYSREGLDATKAWLYSKAYSIYGGSFEVQNNITARQILKLPVAK